MVYSIILERNTYSSLQKQILNGMQTLWPKYAAQQRHTLVYSNGGQCMIFLMHTGYVCIYRLFYVHTTHKPHTLTKGPTKNTAQSPAHPCISASQFCTPDKIMLINLV